MENDVHSPTELEELAAFFEGRLVGERKARVEARLVRDEDYYDVFMEMVRLQEEKALKDRAPERRVLRWKLWRFAAPLATAAMLALAVGGLLRIRTDDWARDLDAAVIVAMGEGWDDPGWSRLRSEGVAASQYRPEQLVFRLGARTVDLRVALAASDRVAGARLGDRCAELARAATLLTAASQYERLRQPRDQMTLESLRAAAAEAERSLVQSLGRGSPEARLFTLGQWAEAGRLAAFTCDADALRRIVRAAPEPVSAEISPQVEILKAIVSQAVSGDQGCTDAAAAWTEILSTLAG